MTFSQFKQELIKTKEYDLMSEDEISIKFARIHVDKALHSAHDNLKQAAGSFNSDYNSQKRSILNAYPLHNVN